VSTFSQNIRPYVDAELLRAAEAESRGEIAEAFTHLERAHILGQASTVQHVRVHCRMFTWGWRQRSGRERMGQVLRIIGAATQTAFGLVPSGNTGGANISPFKSLPVAPELAELIRQAQTRGE
jgi:hypothetical protein